ncbi:YtpI family protein [Salirhabdus sp. Marseille-P4669]|uniref:YtpI family protein n=1 Tax=Salirhabdus sp. Marseille-P4669 TaxID=2042310 RepID=UPI000C79829A|nr:YtpI family protein [Salirhabdus sp. Marseille-P4669]
MIILPILIILTLVMYIFFKVKILSLKDPLLMHFTNAKARLALGFLIAVFGINQYLFYETTLSLIIGIVFVVIGIAQLQYGFKLYRHYRNELLKHEVVAE